MFSTVSLNDGDSGAVKTSGLRRVTWAKSYVTVMICILNAVRAC
jgi:hypothetical protein